MDKVFLHNYHVLWLSKEVLDGIEELPAYTIKREAHAMICSEQIRRDTSPVHLAHWLTSCLSNNPSSRTPNPNPDPLENRMALIQPPYGIYQYVRLVGLWRRSRDRGFEERCDQGVPSIPQSKFSVLQIGGGGGGTTVSIHCSVILFVTSWSISSGADVAIRLKVCPGPRSRCGYDMGIDVICSSNIDDGSWRSHNWPFDHRHATFRLSLTRVHGPTDIILMFEIEESEEERNEVQKLWSSCGDLLS